MQRRVHLHGGIAALPGRLDVHQRARHRRRYAPHRHVQESGTHSTVVRQSELPLKNIFGRSRRFYLQLMEAPATYCSTGV